MYSTRLLWTNDAAPQGLVRKHESVRNMITHHFNTSEAPYVCVSVTSPSAFYSKLS